MSATFEIDNPEDDTGIDYDSIENDFVGDDEDVGEIPPEVVRKVLGKSKVDKDGVKGEVTVSGPQGKSILGKSIRAKLLPGGLYQLYFQEGGELPRHLQGLFTDVKAIEQAVNHYLTESNKEVQSA